MRDRLARIADGFAIAVAVSLPWSISQTEFLLLIWFLVLIPTLDRASLLAEVKTAAGGLPIALLALAAVGMAWADVGWSERLGGLDAFFKLLVIPLLFVQYRRSANGVAVMVGYLASCVALLAISLATMAWQWNAPELTPSFGVPVKAIGTQNTEFICCAFVVLFLGIEKFRRGHPRIALGIISLAVLFIANSFYVAHVYAAYSTIPLASLVIAPILLVVLLFRELGAMRALGLLGAGAVICAILWVYSPQPRYLAFKAWDIIEPLEQGWVGNRPGFWKRSLSFISEAPILGHGTGSIHKRFAGDQTAGELPWDTTNPLQQTFAVGLQIGIVGMCVLWAMWLSHLWLFQGSLMPHWVGLVIVIQNVVGSLFDSLLFDSTLGWTYVFGVGVAGGMTKQLRANAAVVPH
jgi:O-antigen ligase